MNLGPDRTHMPDGEAPDVDAAGQLALAAYYRDVHENKPAWQRERDGA